MRYEKPELKIEELNPIEDIMAEGLSTGGFSPIFEENQDEGDLGFEVLSTAFENIFDI